MAACRLLFFAMIVPTAIAGSCLTDDPCCGMKGKVLRNCLVRDNPMVLRSDEIEELNIIYDPSRWSEFSVRILPSCRAREACLQEGGSCRTTCLADEKKYGSRNCLGGGGCVCCVKISMPKHRCYYLGGSCVQTVNHTTQNVLFHGCKHGHKTGYKCAINKNPDCKGAVKYCCGLVGDSLTYCTEYYNCLPTCRSTQACNNIGGSTFPANNVGDTMFISRYRCLTLECQQQTANDGFLAMVPQEVFKPGCCRDINNTMYLNNAILVDDRACKNRVCVSGTWQNATYTGSDPMCCLDSNGFWHTDTSISTNDTTCSSQQCTNGNMTDITYAGSLCCLNDSSVYVPDSTLEVHDAACVDQLCTAGTMSVTVYTGSNPMCCQDSAGMYYPDAFILTDDASCTSQQCTNGTLAGVAYAGTTCCSNYVDPTLGTYYPDLFIFTDVASCTDYQCTMGSWIISPFPYTGFTPCP